MVMLLLNFLWGNCLYCPPPITFYALYMAINKKFTIDVEKVNNEIAIKAQK